MAGMAEESEEKVGVRGAAAAEEGGQPPVIKRSWSAPTPASVRRIGTVAFLNMLSVMMSLPLLTFVWTGTEKAGGDRVKGGSLTSMGSLLNSLGELVTAATLGAMSDYFGRKPFLFLSILGTAGTLAVAGFEALGIFGASGHLWLFSALAFAGFCGNCSVFVKAYVADSVAEEQRAACFAKVFAAVGSCFVIGPLLGIGLSRISLVLPFFLGVAICCANMVVVTRMPESLLPEYRAKTVEWQKANPFGPLVFFVQSRFLGLFGFMAFLDQFSTYMIQVGFVPFCAAAWEVGPAVTSTLLMFFGVCTVLVMVFVMKPIVARSGELGATKAGYALTGVSFILMGVASYGPSPWFLLPALAFASLGAISSPAEVACASRCVDPTQQGMLQAANGSLDVVGKLTGAAMVYAVWEPTARQGHYSVIWWVACAIVAPGVVAAFLLERVMPKHLREAMSGAAGVVAKTGCQANAAEGNGHAQAHLPPTILGREQGEHDPLDKIGVAIADGANSPNSPHEMNDLLRKVVVRPSNRFGCLQWFGARASNKGFNGVVTSVSS